MQNRRNRPYVQTGIQQPSSSKSEIKKVWFVMVLVLLMGLFVMNRPSTAKQLTAPSASMGVAEDAASSKPQQPVFPDIDVTGFTPIQRKMLEAMKVEYAKQPMSYDKTVLEYTEGTRESWCADFISVIRFTAGKPFVNKETGYWRIPGVQTLRDYYAASQAYHFVGTYTPKFGDVAFYFGETPDGSNREHVAFVLDVKGDVLVTLGGNETDKGILQIRSNKLAEGERGLAGFGESSL